MKILFDQGTPVPLRHCLPGHPIDTAFERGWHAFRNGDLLDAAEREGYNVLITTEQNLKYQRNLSEKNIAIIVILSTSWPRIQAHVDQIAAALDQARAGSFIEIPVP